MCELIWGEINPARCPACRRPLGAGRILIGWQHPHGRVYHCRHCGHFWSAPVRLAPLFALSCAPRTDGRPPRSRHLRTPRP